MNKNIDTHFECRRLLSWFVQTYESFTYIGNFRASLFVSHIRVSLSVLTTNNHRNFIFRKIKLIFEFSFSLPFDTDINLILRRKISCILFSRQKMCMILHTKTLFILKFLHKTTQNATYSDCILKEVILIWILASTIIFYMFPKNDTHNFCLH